MGFLGKIRDKLQFQHGQHLLEYSVLLALVMVGIITMSRYVIRSWNANLKGWEDSIVDSAEDPLESVPYTFPQCTDPDWLDVGCNGGELDFCTGNQFFCPGPRYMLQKRVYFPAGCNCPAAPGNPVNPTEAPSYQCIEHDCCCEVFPNGFCGSAATQLGADPIPDCQPQGVMPKNPDGTCPNGFEEVYIQCGADAAGVQRWGCQITPLCATECLDPPYPVGHPAYGDYCNPGPPVVNTEHSFVDPGSCSVAPPVDCEVECALGSYAIRNGRACGPCELPGIEKIIQPPSAPPVFCGAGPDGLPSFWFDRSLTGCSDPKAWKPCCNN